MRLPLANFATQGLLMNMTVVETPFLEPARCVKVGPVAQVLSWE